MDIVKEVFEERIVQELNGDNRPPFATPTTQEEEIIKFSRSVPQGTIYENVKHDYGQAKEFKNSALQVLATITECRDSYIDMTVSKTNSSDQVLEKLEFGKVFEQFIEEAKLNAVLYKHMKTSAEVIGPAMSSVELLAAAANSAEADAELREVEMVKDVHCIGPPPPTMVMESKSAIAGCFEENSTWHVSKGKNSGSKGVENVADKRVPLLLHLLTGLHIFPLKPLFLVKVQQGIPTELNVQSKSFHLASRYAWCVKSDVENTYHLSNLGSVIISEQKVFDRLVGNSYKKGSIKHLLNHRQIPRDDSTFIGWLCGLLSKSTNKDKEDDLASKKMAVEIINTMALNLSKQAIPHVLEFYSWSSRNDDPKFWEAFVTDLIVISEGYSELINSKLEPALHIALGAFRYTEQMSRCVTSVVLGQFAEYMHLEIVSHYESVLHCILNAQDKALDEVKKSYSALAAFCENTGEETLPFLYPLMAKLLVALHRSTCNLQETCMSASGSFASAAEQVFLPYAERVLEVMKMFMVLKKDEDLCFRPRATELVGIAALDVGRARMGTILPCFIEFAITGYGVEYSELQECTHRFFSKEAGTLDERLVHYLPHIVPLLFCSYNFDDGSAVDIHDNEVIMVFDPGG